MTIHKLGGSLALMLFLTACAVGPDYVAPEIEMGEQYHAAWQPIDAEAAVAPRDGQWWQLFDDPQLNAWIAQLHEANASLEQAEARYRQAQANLAQARSGLFPTLSSGASGQRSGSGAANSSPQNQYNLNLNAAWEVDLWGRVRRSVEASDAQLEASAADVLATRLSLESLFVQSYFQAKQVLASKKLYEQTLAAYERSLQDNQNRLAVGLVSSADVATAQAQLDNARTQRLALDRQWGQLHNAMAVLVGVVPSAFELVVDDIQPPLPTVPVSIPAQLLVQRPDVAAAERRMAAANAQIGVAQSAWLPNLNLSAQGGYRSGSWSEWISAPARFWSLGPSLALAIFDGGARRARLNEAIAAYDAQAAAYKQTVLDALKEVEDGLVQWHGLQQELISQQRALEAARESLRLTRNQFDAGLIDYLSVVQVETNALSTERATLALEKDLYVAVAQLIAALGGRW